MVVIASSTQAPGRPQALALVLEDDPSFRTVLAELLSDEGLDYRVCHSYAELRAAVDQAGASIVLADFWGTSHLEPTPLERQEIRDLGRRAPTILLTGRSWARHELAEELGVVCLLPKPIDVEQLVEQVRRCLALARTPRNL
jgi:DNA-binding NtrC family response regulator